MDFYHIIFETMKKNDAANFLTVINIFDGASFSRLCHKRYRRKGGFSYLKSMVVKVDKSKSNDFICIVEGLIHDYEYNLFVRLNGKNLIEDRNLS